MLSPEAQKEFTSRKMHNLVTMMFELLDESVVPKLELWQFYWNQSPFVQYMLGAHYVVTRVSPFVPATEDRLREAVQLVPFPIMPFFFRKNGLNVLLNNDRFASSVKGN